MLLRRNTKPIVPNYPVILLVIFLKMASSIESHVNRVLSPLEEEEQEDRNVRDTKIVSTDEGRLSRPDIDLEPNSPSFVRERSLTFGTPSGEVQFRRPTHYEHIGEPAQDPRVYILNKIKATKVEIKIRMTLGFKLLQCKLRYL